MDEERLPKQVLSWTPVGSRRPGRPKDTWRRTIQNDMRNNGIGAENMERVASAEQIGEDLLLTYRPSKARRGLSKSQNNNQQFTDNISQ